MPVQYVIEEWDFRDLVLQMKPPVLIPRPETEVSPFMTFTVFLFIISITLPTCFTNYRYIHVSS